MNSFIHTPTPRSLTDILVDVKAFGAVGDGVTDDTAAIQAAVNSGSVVMFPEGIYEISSTISSAIGLKLVAEKGQATISGGNFLGFSISAGDIYLRGINASGFYDGTDENTTNYATAFIRIPDGSTIDSVFLREVGFSTTRVGIVANSGTANDYTPSTTTTISKLDVYDCTFTTMSLGLSFRCQVSEASVLECNFKNIMGAGRSVGGVYIYLDGQGYGNAIYDNIGNINVSNNRFHTIINRTVTGDSTTGNNYETHAVAASGNQVVISNNTMVDVTGNYYDTEGIYTKARHFVISGNVMRDSGAVQGSIAIKGTQDDGDGSNTSPYGDRGIVSENVIVYTRDSYNNDGNVMDLDTVGIFVASCVNVKVTNNLIIGANESCIYLNGGTGSKNNGNTILDNTFHNFTGGRLISARGAFQDLSIQGNSASNITTDNKSVTFIYLDGEVVNRGMAWKNVMIHNNRLKLGDVTTNDTGLILSFMRVNGTAYDITDLSVQANIIDVYSSTADIRPIYLTGAGGTLSGLVIKDNVFPALYTSWPIYWGDLVPSTYDVEVEHDYQTTDNTTRTASLVRCEDGKILWAETEAVIHRTDAVTSTAQKDRIDYLGYAASGTLTQISSTTDTSIGNATGVAISFNDTADQLQLRVNGGTDETYTYHIKSRAIVR